MNYFKEVKKNFGFGCMRLPIKNEEIDYLELNKMVDYFIANGFNYFDTAHMYVNEKSEEALRESLVKRYPRDAYVFTDKLSTSYFKKQEEIRPLFFTQLKKCGLEYFDFYLMHSQNKQTFEKYVSLHAYEEALKLKAEGYIKHFGISFHDTAAVLDEILTKYPMIEVVQIQFNYLDYDDPAVQGRLCYEVARKHGKPIIVMEPVKGGRLVNLPKEAASILEALHGGSNASYAIRFAASFPGVFMVLSGMSNIEQMKDNISYMKDFKPFANFEYQKVNEVIKILKSQSLINCTACSYCVLGCPKKILIPKLFACYNAKKQNGDWNQDYYYELYTASNGKASYCIKCGKCEQICPQKLPIKKLLQMVSEEFEK